MKREIFCAGCSLEMRDLFPTNEPYPGEHVKFEVGLAKEEYICDYCGKVIQPGQTCVAYSNWVDHGQLYQPWEHDYIISADDPAFFHLANMGKGVVEAIG